MLLLLDKGSHWIHHFLHHQLLLLKEHLRGTLNWLRNLTLGKLVNEVIDDIFCIVGVSTDLLDQTLSHSWILLIDLLD